jgi:hypothetical protein
MAAPVKPIDVRAACLPSKRSKGGRLLIALLRGEKLDPGTAFAQHNLTTIYARASELRALGWPVAVVYKPHPVRRGEDYPVYGFDDHFLRWVSKQKVVDPAAYKHQHGRGKFKV